MKTFKAFRIHERDGGIVAGFEQMDGDALTPGDVVIRVRFSSINYKDALAATGAGRILRRYPLNGGIDLSGELDVDEWGWGDSTLHDFDFDGIPVYFKLDGKGNPTGETVDENAWGENIPENFAPVMDTFFHGE